ncbi:MBL fold metallo-hydrolase [Ruminiclostridium cellobioparum]|uniref:MBL fold metallo-hydrolase n=1 Tax=Ruminiclostridium cellobioparum TaxID=29355 RepID=UPI00047F0861|nr:MBL fold metallo-hydrolase [Ruminiclostridium cellobioparum]
MMEIIKVKKRNIVFKYNIADWDLNLHLIVGNKYNYIIDTGLGSLSISPVIEYLGNNRNPVIAVNTHYHWDHIWGNGSLENCTIISHRLCRKIISEKWDEMLEKRKQFVRGEVQKCLPNLTFEDTIYFPDDKIKIFYTPGHTVDCISVLDEEEGVINTGDNIGDTMEEIVPSVETGKEVFINTLLKYKKMDFDTCVSGHNTVLGREVIDIILKEIDV